MASSKPSIPSVMTAWHFTSAQGGLDKNLTLNTSAPLPSHDATSLGKDKVLVQVLATSLNPVDHKIVEIPVAGRFVVKTPASPGLDFAGRVAAAGNETGLKNGQLVFGRLDGPTQFGTLAEYTVAPKPGVAPLPEGLDPKDAACAGTAGLTAYQCIVPNIKRNAGDRVFINGGSGGTGTFGIQIAKAVGCYVTTSCSARNVELCKALGADEVIDYTKDDVVEAVKKSAENGGKFDLIVDNVGNSGKLYWQCHHFTSQQAKYVQVGAPASAYSALDMAMKFLWPGLIGGGKRQFQFWQVSSKPEQLEEIGRWMAEGKVKAVVEEVFSMQDARKAFEKLRTGRTKGKVVVVVKDG
ncbi:hypothetical protein H2200_008253 [Cladophialophora chaetospira]|uniref:Enoyl reductase (ER) domain-containing protein n=1 Tax=Cladophialophora chaetospira TaxID=386627 RepID=A0AA39CGE6_9EURO|nr:hypothetical protein H2200_008253 [Cladophialophora chaetospira]